MAISFFFLPCCRWSHIPLSSTHNVRRSIGGHHPSLHSRQQSNASILLDQGRLERGSVFFAIIVVTYFWDVNFSTGFIHPLERKSSCKLLSCVLSPQRREIYGSEFHSNWKESEFWSIIFVTWWGGAHPSLACRYCACFLFWLLKHFQVISHEQNLTVTIDEATVGSYYCHAETPGYSQITSRSAEVLMTGRPKISSSQIQTGVEGENVHINCAAISIPEAKSVVWTYHGSALDDSESRPF